MRCGFALVLFAALGAAETQLVSLSRLQQSPPAAAWSCGTSTPSDAISAVLMGAVVHAGTTRATVVALGCEQVQEEEEEQSVMPRSQLVPLFSEADLKQGVSLSNNFRDRYLTPFFLNAHLAVCEDDAVPPLAPAAVSDPTLLAGRRCFSEMDLKDGSTLPTPALIHSRSL